MKRLYNEFGNAVAERILWPLRQNISLRDNPIFKISGEIEGAEVQLYGIFNERINEPIFNARRETLPHKQTQI